MPILKIGQFSINLLFDEDMPPNEVKFVNPDGTTITITNIGLHYYNYEEQKPLTFEEMNKIRNESHDRIKRIRRELLNQKRISSTKLTNL